MMFIAGLVSLGAVLVFVFWYGLQRAAPELKASTHMMTLVGFIVLSGSVYLLSGTPDYADKNLANVQDDIGAALLPDGLGPLEAYGGLVQADSKDKAAWLNASANLREVRRPVEAADALIRAAVLSDDGVERASLFGAAGEILVSAAGGGVDAEAAAAFTAALEADPNSLGALYYLGREARIRSDDPAARSYWLRFLQSAPQDHPLIAEVRGNLALIGDGQEAAPRIAPVLTEDMIAQFEGLDDQERHAQIVSMLERRGARLDGQGAEVGADQWRELARAYLQIDELEGAKAAYDRAFELAPDDKALALERSQLQP